MILILSQGATALHWKLATEVLLVVPVIFWRDMSLILKGEEVQFPVPPDPMKRVHWEMVMGMPRIPVEWRLVKVRSLAT